MDCKTAAASTSLNTHQGRTATPGRLRSTTLLSTDMAPNRYFSASGPYLLTSRRYPEGVLVRLMHAIDGTDCFRAKLEADIDRPFPRRCYALREELS